MAGHPTFPVEVLTPEGSVFDGEVEMVSTRTGTGQVGILARHEPLMATLVPTELRLHGAEGESDVLRYAQGEGYVQMYGNRTLLLVEEAIAPDDLDVEDLKGRLERAETEIEEAEDESEAKRAAERAKRRYEAFIEIAQSSS
jgi:F-type H+-transporting ATPase subunit epsilon